VLSCAIITRRRAHFHNNRPLQSPDGTFLYDIPAPQLLREMQPDAKFIVTLTDPVRRMYSDYYFLHDNLKPLRVNMMHNKSAEEFHERVASQVNGFNACVRVYVDKMKPQLGKVRGGTSGGGSSSSSGGSSSSSVGSSSGNSSSIHTTAHSTNSISNSNSNSNVHSNSGGSGHMPHLYPQPGDDTFPVWFRAAQM